jgi:hypothetical protein
VASLSAVALTPLATVHHAVTFTLEPSAEGGAAAAPECKDCAKVVKNSLSLSAVLVAVPAAAVVVLVVPVAGVVGVLVAVAGGCRRLSTLLKAANRRVTPRLGAGAAMSVLGTVFVVAVVAVVAVVWVTGVVVGVPDAAEVAFVGAGEAPKDCASCSRR